MGIDVVSDIVVTPFKGIKYEELIENLGKQAQLKNYRVTKIVNVDHIKEEKDLLKDISIGYENYKIVEICNLVNCNEIISSDLNAGVFMPVRFAVYQPSGENTIFVSYLKPTSFSALFGSARMNKVASRMANDMNEIVLGADF
jgi:uncharacterized protein (DUF302 family)